MAKYRISIENLEPDSSWDESEEIYCEGFAIIGDQEDGGQVVIHDVSIMDLASFIYSNSLFRKAAMLVMTVRSLMGKDDDD